MLRIALSCFLLLIVITVRAQNCDWAKTYIAEPPACVQWNKYKLVFEDHFNGTELDTFKWQNHYPWGRHLVNARSLSFNTDGQNMEISGGILKFTVKKETIHANIRDYREPGCIEPDIGNCLLEDGKPNRRTFNYTTSMIYSKRKFGPGKYEIRCKIPSIDGVWPAFWLFGWCSQEIDIFEFNNSKINSGTDISSKKVRMTYHKEPACIGDRKTCSKPSHFYGVNYSEGFHIFAVEWDYHKIVWSVDGQEVRTIHRYMDMLGQELDPCNIEAGTYFENPLLPSFNMNVLATIGVKNFCEPEDCSRGIYPTQMQIDYIKVWEKVEGVHQINIFPNPTNGTIQVSTMDSNEKISYLQVRSVLGQILFAGEIIGTNAVSIDLSNQPSGLYFVTATIEGTILSGKVVLQ